MILHKNSQEILDSQPSVIIRETLGVTGSLALVIALVILIIVINH